MKFTIVSGIILIAGWLLIFLPLQLKTRNTDTLVPILPENITPPNLEIRTSTTPIPRENNVSATPISETSTVKLLPTNEDQTSPTASPSNKPVEVNP